MIRRELARPDEVLTIIGDDGEPVEIDVVSRAAMRELVLDVEALLAMSGGVATIAVDRVRTGVPHEMVTVMAVAEWKDRPDARSQAEREAPQQQPPAPVVTVTPGDAEADRAIAELEAELEGGEIAPADESLSRAPDDPDVPEEDLSSIPTHLRSAV